MFLFVWVTGETDSNVGVMRKCCRFFCGWFMKLSMLSPEEGALPILHCILEDSSKLEKGGYHSNIRSYPTKYGSMDKEEEKEQSEKLWNVSHGVFGLEKRYGQL